MFCFDRIHKSRTEKRSSLIAKLRSFDIKAMITYSVYMNVCPIPILYVFGKKSKSYMFYVEKSYIYNDNFFEKEFDIIKIKKI